MVGVFVPVGSPAEVFLVENGIPELKFDTDTDLSDLVVENDRDFLIAAIGRLSPEKGFRDLVDAMAYFNKDNANYKLIGIDVFRIVNS